MRIAMVSEHASPLAALGGADAGGQNVHVASLAAALAARGHQVVVYTRRDDPHLPEQVPLCEGVDVVHVPVGPARHVPKDELLAYMTGFGRRLAKDWQTYGAPDVVHAHFWMSGLAALTATDDVAVPVVHTYHALGSVKRRHQRDKDTSPAGRVDYEAEIGRRADAVVATCHDEVAELRALGVPEDRMRIVPCGVDTAHFSPVGLPAPPARTRRHRLLSLGRLVERKGVDTVVTALAELPDTELVVAGGPPASELDADPEVQRLRALADGLGVGDRVTFLGAVAHDDVPGLIRSADAVVATPWYEPFGIVPLEAAACGRPLVGSAVGGLLDTVEHGVTGLLVPPRDPGALAAALADLLADPDRRKAYGRAARRRAVARYGWDQVAAATEEVYAEVAAQARLQGATA